MKLRLYTLYFTLLLPFVCTDSGDSGLWRHCNDDMFINLVTSINTALNYMRQNMRYINLDGVLGIRTCADQLNVVLKKTAAGLLPENVLNTLLYLRNYSSAIADDAIYWIERNQPTYFATVGRLLSSGTWSLDYPLRRINKVYQKYASCEMASFNEGSSDSCLSNISQNRGDGKARCQVTKQCWKTMTNTLSKAYALTHNVLFLQVIEMFGCLSSATQQLNVSLEEMDLLKDILCSNVLRDAEECAKSNYPPMCQDLFMEQIALCGIYGYDDFMNDEWTKKFLGWQDPSGCYKRQSRYSCIRKDLKIKSSSRPKREDKVLKDNCSSHTTSVALFAASVNLRYCVERMMAVPMYMM